MATVDGDNVTFTLNPESMEFSTNYSNFSNTTSPSINAPLPNYLVWIYGLLLVTGINLCSLVGIAVNPFSKKPWYKQLLLFMVSLAVGVLSGSSLLFLLSGALEFDAMEWDFRKNYITKVTVVLSSVFLFFNFEQLLKMLLAAVVVRRDVVKAEDARHSPDCHLPHTPNKGIQNATVSTSVASLPTQYTYDACQLDVSGAVDVKGSTKSCNENNAFSLEELSVPSQCQNDSHTDVTLSDAAELPKKSFSAVFPDSGTNIAPNDDTNKGQVPAFPEPITIRRRRTNSNSIKTRSSLAVSFSQVQPVAWMVIFGDGIHNFVDGLSIGAGMAQNFPTGLSIAIAVFAEELPHEIGDLAVLLRAGLPLRRALMLNFLSACLCYAGFAIGAILGEFKETSAVIYAFAAGLFMYISLTDLLPELSPESCQKSDDLDENNAKSDTVVQELPLRRMLTHLAVADSGMLFGYFIMLLLSMYSDYIEKLANIAN